MNTQQQTLNEKIAQIIYAEMEDYYGSETCIPALEKLFLSEQIELLTKLKELNTIDYENTWKDIEDKISDLTNQLNNIQ